MYSVFFLSFSFLLAWVCGVALVFSVRCFHLVPDTYHTAWVFLSFDSYFFVRTRYRMSRYLCAYGGGGRWTGMVVRCVRRRWAALAIATYLVQSQIPEFNLRKNFRNRRCIPWAGLWYTGGNYRSCYDNEHLGLDSEWRQILLSGTQNSNDYDYGHG